MKGHEALELLSVGLAVVGIVLSVMALRQINAQAPVQTTVATVSPQSVGTALEGGIPIVKGLATPSAAAEQARA